jgi:xanthine dehydrogenase large subunit
MTVDAERLRRIVTRLEVTSEYRARRRRIAADNAAGGTLRRGLALTPVKFGVSFVTTHLNQAGALVHVYRDGSVQLNHGGTEMGQGLLVKVAALVARELGLDLARVQVTAAHTGKVPNASATAASASTDLNAAAAVQAAREIRGRLAAVAAHHLGVPPEEIVFADGSLHGGGRTVSFAEAALLAHGARISLSATGFHRTPEIEWDLRTFSGRPFLYFACGAAVSEVVVDVLTGEHRVLRVDVLHDCGTSLNPAIDRGQIEGAFVQGMGWLTTEDVVWDASGRLLTHSPSTYKIPTAGDVPADFRVALFDGAPGGGAGGSKAVGEPPLMLAISVFHAIRDAIASVAAPGRTVRLDAPATPERVLAALDALAEGRP